jgi:hypothetical protein
MRMFYEEKISKIKFKKFDNRDTPTASHVDKLKKVISHEVKPFFERSNCLGVAGSVVFFLTGKSVFFSDEEIFSVPMNKFFLKRDSVFSYKIVEDLLKQSKEPEHAIFYIEFGGNFHSLVIEKESNEKMTLFRVYQSWVNKFTLIDWLEGKGKYPYTALELIEFIQDTINKIYKESERSACCSFFCSNKVNIIIEIKKFKFNTHFLEKNYERIYTEQSLKNEL